MDVPLDDIDNCRAAHARLAAALANIADERFHQPSALPDWTIGHVISHLARNAEAMCRRIEAAKRDDMAKQYLGGPAGRADEIEQGARRVPDKLRRDVGKWSRRLDDVFDNLPATAWARRVRTVAGGEHCIAQLPFRRWREVDVHMVDLGVATPAQWSQDFIDRALPRLVEGLRGRSDDRVLAAWLLGRGSQRGPCFSRADEIGETDLRQHTELLAVGKQVQIPA